MTLYKISVSLLTWRITDNHRECPHWPGCHTGSPCSPERRCSADTMRESPHPPLQWTQEGAGEHLQTTGTAPGQAAAQSHNPPCNPQCQSDGSLKLKKKQYYLDKFDVLHLLMRDSVGRFLIEGREFCFFSLSGAGAPHGVPWLARTSQRHSWQSVS